MNAIIPTEMGKSQLAAALADKGKYDFAEVCPKCGVKLALEATKCPSCGVMLLMWLTKKDIPVLCYEDGPVCPKCERPISEENYWAVDGEECAACMDAMIDASDGRLEEEFS